MTPLELYDRAAEDAAGTVLRRYSTSFGMASRLLGSRSRIDIGNIYALVRVADEIVDGVASAAGLGLDEVSRHLDALEADVEQALRTGYSVNLIVHAFARTARRTGIGTDLTAPFFASMRADLSATEHTDESFAAYVYGSAEVVGLMCLAVFLDGREPRERERLERGARALGAAFQKVNFLRDLSADFGALGRSYFPGVRVSEFDEDAKDRLLDDLDRDLEEAASVIPLLPRRHRRAVAAAHGLFAELSRRLRRTPAALIAAERVSVPQLVKVRVLAASLAAAPGRRA
ncbi:squalene/phytoene synthase family protein [Naasia sp. SYSU D00948]|uniref:phytoene/squalene synthase family protein n=1 Tax=Naasia sp. SYSU D00948 TaxID=2817379 RepID=UPI0027DC7EA5|nr:squalene/phytoene synthase family protein [Naasia sp. SYSU D00948]